MKILYNRLCKEYYRIIFITKSTYFMNYLKNISNNTTIQIPLPGNKTSSIVRNISPHNFPLYSPTESQAGP